MGLPVRWWWGGAVLALAAGVGIALWRAPHTVSIPVESTAPPAGGAPASDVPPPMPAPPSLAQDAAPPGVEPTQWAALQREMADRPLELQRLRDYLTYADALQRFRSGDAATRRALARQVDAGLDERLARREVGAAEARLIKSATLEVLLPDAGARRDALDQWQAARAADSPPPDPAARQRDADFERRQAAVVAAWRAQPASLRDPQALERDLDALRRSVYPDPPADPQGGSR